MTMLSFGQPVGGIVQIAYTVKDIERGMRDYTERLNVGPWFVTGPFVPSRGFYRGQPTDMSLTLAVAYSGHMMVELIEQHDDKPSVYQETIRTKGYGFHHWGMCSRSFDADVARYEKAGLPGRIFRCLAARRSDRLRRNESRPAWYARNYRDHRRA
jgi:Glyoxalase/Bleomycin resistance protein/Dioxygenase superfamily